MKERKTKPWNGDQTRSTRKKSMHGSERNRERKIPIT